MQWIIFRNSSIFFVEKKLKECFYFYTKKSRYFKLLSKLLNCLRVFISSETWGKKLFCGKHFRSFLSQKVTIRMWVQLSVFWKRSRGTESCYCSLFTVLCYWGLVAVLWQDEGTFRCSVARGVFFFFYIIIILIATTLKKNNIITLIFVLLNLSLKKTNISASKEWWHSNNQN